MTNSKQCADCQHILPLEAFFKTQGGAGRSDRCKGCIEKRAEAYRAERQLKLKAEDAEYEAFQLSDEYKGQLPPSHLMDAHFRVLRDPERIRGERPLSNRPHMTSCAGCGERVTKRSLYSYRAGKRSKFCVPCTKRRATERECTSCGETKLTSEFFEGLNGVSPHCRSCRHKREREKRCSKCGVTNVRRQII